MSAQNTNLSTLSDSDLIRLYRQETSEVKKTTIFNTLLYGRKANGKSWHKNILTHCSNEVKKFRFCNWIDRDDLYQVVLKKFHETVVRNFDVDSKFCFSTYVWWAINSSINRLIQEFKTKKRIKDMQPGENINLDATFENNKSFGEIISSDSQFGAIKTLNKTADFDDTLFYRNLINFIKEDIKEQDDTIDIDKMLKTELIYLIKHNECNNRYLTEICERYNVELNEVYNMITVLTEDLEKRVFRDFINLVQHGINDDEVLLIKHKCKKDFINKSRQKMNERIREKIKELNLSVEEVFN